MLNGSNTVNVKTIFNVKTIALCSVLIGVTGCNTTATTQKTESAEVNAISSVSGIVTYRERIALPPNATLTIKLQDTSKQDVAAMLIAEKTIDLTTSPPWDFNLHYDPSKLDEKGRYSLQARVEVDGQLRFINMSHVAAFNAASPISILVSAVSQQENNNKAMLEAHSWQLTEIKGQVVANKSTKTIGINFNEKEKGINGFSGCNQFSGRYDISDTKLSFPPMMSTQMACPGSDTEFSYLQALSKVDGYNIEGTTLKMLNKEDETLLKFKIKSSNK